MMRSLPGTGMPDGPVQSEARTVRRRAGNRDSDAVAVESALTIEVRFDVDGATFSEVVASTMRTPGNDEDLVVGYFRAEGVIVTPAEIANFEARSTPSGDRVTAVFAPGAMPQLDGARRLSAMSSACGVCGKADILSGAGSVVRSGLVVRPEVIASMPSALSGRQPVFARTGGVHAAALFTADGDPVAVCEDVGRHNAVDKVLGSALRKVCDLESLVLCVSARAGYEIVQKAASCGVQVVVAISAPTTAAIDTAVAAGLTLVAFARGETFNVYAHPERVYPAGSRVLPLRSDEAGNVG